MLAKKLFSPMWTFLETVRFTIREITFLIHSELLPPCLQGDPRVIYFV